jgi:hypothetical protein
MKFSVKMFLCLFAFVFTSASALAQIPQALSSLLPVGAEEISLQGQAADGSACEVGISLYASSIFNLALSVNNDSRRFGHFQIGLGHELADLNENAGTLIAVSTLKAGEEYSSDSRATLIVERNESTLQSVRVHTEREGWLGYKTESDETCSF